MLNKYLDVKPEVAQAIAEGKPVVALESTIISHGMPYPQNVETALEVEKIIRENGAVPATIAIIGGRLKAGLTPEEIEEEEEQTLIGFCVLGGIFGEGIDLKKDSLIGVIVVGTGLPQVGCEREILKGYFDEDGENGFDYSYRYPGMNKVLQAAGRVIRTAEDVGITVLLEDRFQQYSYRRLFPREWEQVQPVTVDTVAKKVERFWDAWLWQKG